MTEKERLEDLLTMHCFLKERGLSIAEQAEKDIEETNPKLLQQFKEQLILVA